MLTVTIFVECFNGSENLFEQFTINFSNEMMQNFWSARLINDEYLDYQDEGLDIERIKFFDNSDILGIYFYGLLNYLLFH